MSSWPTCLSLCSNRGCAHWPAPPLTSAAGRCNRGRLAGAQGGGRAEKGAGLPAGRQAVPGHAQRCALPACGLQAAASKAWSAALGHLADSMTEAYHCIGDERLSVHARLCRFSAVWYGRVGLAAQRLSSARRRGVGLSYAVCTSA